MKGRSILKSFAWIVLTTVFGLSQLWLDGATHAFRHDGALPAISILQSGTLLFFAWGVTMSLVVDLFFNREVLSRMYANGSWSYWWRAAVFSFVPLVIWMLVDFGYVVSRGRMDPWQIHSFVILNYFVSGVAALYAFVVKQYGFVGG